MNIQHKLNLREMELTSLLEIMRAINANVTSKDLFKIFKFTLRSNQYVSKMALYVYEEKWEYKESYGTDHKFKTEELCENVMAKTAICHKDDLSGPFQEFDVAIPVTHKDKRLAFVFLGKKDTVEDDELFDLDFIEALANIIVVANENKKLARKEQQQAEMKRQMEIASDVQAMLFPKKLPQLDLVKVQATYEPHHSVGGDYYDYIRINDHQFLICIADVSGKGIPAALLMSNFQAGLRTITQQTLDFEVIVKSLNELIRVNSGGENYITAFFCLCNIKTKEITFVNAGHVPPCIITPDKKHISLDDGTTPLGFFETLPLLDIGHMKTPDSFLLFCHTDGISELCNEEGEEYGTERLSDFLKEHYPNDAPEALHQLLLEELNTFRQSAPFSDDLTFISCHINQALYKG